MKKWGVSKGGSLDKNKKNRYTIISILFFDKHVNTG